MLDHEYDTMREVEDTYWWYRALRGHVADELSRRLRGRNEAVVLDAGCGTGGMLAKLREASPLWKLHGVDISAIALDHARKRGIGNLTAASVDALPFPDAAFDAVVSLDVLYHADLDEQQSASEFGRVLKPGGFLVLNLPALECLAGSHDVAVSGARRYSTRHARALLEKQGLHVLQLHYWNAWLFPPILLWRQISRLFQTTAHAETKSDLIQLPGAVNSMLTRMTRADIGLCSALHPPFGTSVFAVACKSAV